MLNKEAIEKTQGPVNASQKELIRLGIVRTMIIDHQSFRLFQQAAARNKGFLVKIVAGSHDEMLTHGKSVLTRENTGRNGIPLLVRRVEVLTRRVADGKIGVSIERPVEKSFKDFEGSLENLRREVPVVRQYR